MDAPLDLDALGLGAFADRLAALAGEDGAVGRVLSAHRGGVFVATAAGRTLAMPDARLRRAIDADELARPIVGDWVVCVDEGKGARSIRAVAPRRTLLARRAPADRGGGVQALVANVEHVAAVSSFGRDLSVPRLERYLALARDGGARPFVVLTKADECPSPAQADDERGRVAEALRGADVVAVSAFTGAGLAALRARVGFGETLALLGSSGVGKSTLANALVGRDALATGAVRADGKGRHTTTHREILALPGGGCLVDTPGMREVGLVDADLEGTFAEVERFVGGCRFRDCAHGAEPGCALRAAVTAGELDARRLDAYLALGREAGAGGGPAAGARAARSSARRRR